MRRSFNQRLGVDGSIHERVEGPGQSQSVICRLRSGWAVLGDSQFIAGYTLLLSDPAVPSLNDLAPKERAQFLLDMTAIGDALLAVTDAYRINYEILGNTDPVLHAHIFPRRMTEPEEYRSGPVYRYPDAERMSRPFDAVRDGQLREALRRFLEAIGAAISLE